MFVPLASALFSWLAVARPWWLEDAQNAQQGRGDVLHGHRLRSAGAVTGRGERARSGGPRFADLLAGVLRRSGAARVRSLALCWTNGAILGHIWWVTWPHNSKALALSGCDARLRVSRIHIVGTTLSHFCEAGSSTSLPWAMRQSLLWRRQPWSGRGHTVGWTTVFGSGFFFYIQDLSQEEMVFWELDERCLDEVAADRMREAMEEALGLTIVKSETAEAPVEEPC